MTIEQTIEVPASRRLVIDVPPEVPEGRAVLTYTLTPFTLGSRRRKLSKEESLKVIENLCGIKKRLGAFTTVEDFLEMRREDARLEEEKLGRFLKKGE